MRHASYLQTEEKLTLLVVTVSNTKTKTTLALIWNLKKNKHWLIKGAQGVVWMEASVLCYHEADSIL